MNHSWQKCGIAAGAGLLLLTMLLGSNAGAQKLPSKITWIVPFGLGGGTGTSALVLAPRLQEKLSRFGVKEVKCPLGCLHVVVCPMLF